MTAKQWSTLSKDSRESLIFAVFGSQYLALTRSDKNPEEDPIIKEVLKWTQLNGDVAYINIHKEIKVKQLDQKDRTLSD